MAIVKIDGVDVDTEKLSEKGKQFADLVQAAERNIARMNRQVIINKTARNSYVEQILKEVRGGSAN